MDWEKYFDMMIDWKKLPAYRAEPRIDSFIGFYLPEIASDFLNDKIDGIIPELPIRLGSIYKKHENTNYSDRSYKVDFYLIGESRINYLVEFKTDSSSRRDTQDDYLFEAKNKKMNVIVDGILKIASVSSYKTKYSHLINKLKEIELLDDNNQFIGRDNIEIVYVQPDTKDENEKSIDFDWIYNWFKAKETVDSFDINFANALQMWATD